MSTERNLNERFKSVAKKMDSKNKFKKYLHSKEGQEVKSAWS